MLPDLTDCTCVNYYYSTDSNWNADQELFIQAIDSGDDVILESYRNTFSGGEQQLVDDHAFAMIGYNSATGDFIVRNPWGTQDFSQSYDTQFEVSMNTIARVDGDIVVSNSASSDVEILTAPEGWQSSSAYSTPVWVDENASVPVRSLFSAIDTAGKAITEYTVQLIGSGTIGLNGATDLANSAQTAEGEYVVSASDLSKVTYLAGSYVPGAPDGSTHVLVSAYDGTTWSPVTDVSLTITDYASIMPAINTVLAPSQQIFAGSLFTGDGPVTGYNIDQVSGGAFSEYDFSSTELSDVTYTAPSTPGEVTVLAYASAGPDGGYSQNIQIFVGTTVAVAIQSYDNGELSDAVAVADTAANIFANLDGLQTMLAAGVLQGITITDTTDPTETITATQYARDKGLFSILSGNYQLNVTGTVPPQSLTVSSLSHSQTANATDLKAGETVTITLDMSEQKSESHRHARAHADQQLRRYV